ncbi:MAG: winged helix-turn-helix domain-containing protein [Planctomycetales bacterium]|nr:winged helix-turn-helix domain-containing protein [Planctomycetales bacterium]
MADPDFQSMFVPFLCEFSDGEEHAIKQVTEAIADGMDLTRQDREEMLPSGSQRRLANRVGWARTHLKHAKLIEYTGRGVMKITQRGLDTLSSHPNGLTLKKILISLLNTTSGTTKNGHHLRHPLTAINAAARVHLKSKSLV